MIAFRDGWNPNDKDKEIINDIVNKIEEALAANSLGLHTAYEDAHSSFYASVNISEITQLIYENFYQDNNEVVSFVINKNENNSLDVSVDVIK